MMRKWMVAGAGLLSIALVMGSGAARLQAAPPAAQDQAKPAYTLAEYNAYKAADAETNPQAKIKALDDFVKAYPNSTLMPYIYPDYFRTYAALKNYAQAIEYCDRQIALGDKIDVQGRIDAYYVRATAYYLGSSDKAFQTPEMQTKARDAATQGLKILDDLKKPDAVGADQFAQAVKAYKVAFTTIAAMTSMGLKDFPAAVTYYKALLAIDPTAAATHYSLAVAYLTMSPPAASDGFWELARAIDLKVPNAPQVQAYLKNKIIQYQQPSCDKLVDDQVTELLTLAGSTADRPATLNIPSAADLQKARDDTANFIPALKAGGDAGKVMWLASCGLEYPDVAVFAMDKGAVDGDTVTINVYRPTTIDPDAAQKEVETATDPNMQIKVVGQPEASRIQKDDQFRFTGTLVGYTQNPFLLTWDKAKINPEDLPQEKAAPGKKRAPSKKASTN